MHSTGGAGSHDDALFSNHARWRMRQRGIRDADVALLLFGADREASVGGGCVAISISRRRRKQLLIEGYSPSSIERAVRIAAVESGDGEIVTVLRPSDRRGRRYRRAFHTHRPKMLKFARGR